MRRIELFSVPGCEACVDVLRVLTAVAADRPDLQVREVDLTEHPEVAARHGLLACPAVAIDGRVAFVGRVDERRVRAALDAAVPTGGTR